MKKEFPVNKSRQYLTSQAWARRYAKDPSKLKKLYKDATEKAKDVPKGPFGKTWRYLKAMLRLIEAYADGSYRKVPWPTLVMIVAAIVYFLSPIDAFPDFLPVVGFVDDALVVAITLAAVQKDLEKFLAWERARKNRKT